MIFGFCTKAQEDVPITAERRCSEDGSLALAPSWGNRLQTWRDGAWHPEIARPDGYRYRPKVYATQVVAPPVSAACQQCGLTFSYQPKGGDAPRYCSPRCKGASARARWREASSS